ncbi:MAG: ribulose-phosphate 3-epimerase [Clostridiales bacterium]|nr:ribulose-phosphate 3-epimerase [Clostridiales bacterium]
MVLKLSPSILSADFNILGKQIKEVEEAGATYLHIDVMDGNFVPSISYGMPVIKSIRKNTNLFFDVHLMVEEPDRFLQDFKDAGADMITVHYEANKHLHRTITRIKEMGLKAGVALNPSTPVRVLEYIIEQLDMVLIMTVNPGFGGQSFIPFSIRKIQELKQMVERLGISIDIQVDGGISTANVREVIEAGANVIVAGTSVFNGNIKNNIEEFNNIFKDY